MARRRVHWLSGSLPFRAFGEIIGFGGFDFTIDGSKPELAVETLKERLARNIHKFAEATWAQMVAGADSQYVIEDRGPFLSPLIQFRKPV